MLTFPFTAIKRRFANTGSNPPDGVDWVAGTSAGFLESATRPPFNLADSDTPGAFFISGAPTGDVWQGTVDFDGTYAEWRAISGALHISFFAGIDGFDATPGASNDWYVARAVNGAFGQIEVFEQTVYLNGPTYLGRREDGSPSAPELVTAWNWVLPNGTTSTFQSAQWAVAPTATTHVEIVKLSYDYERFPSGDDPVSLGAPFDFFRIETDNLIPIAVVDPVLTTQETGEVTLNGANSYDQGYSVLASLAFFPFTLLCRTITPIGTIAGYLWTVKTENFGEPSVTMATGTSSTIELDLEPGTYRAFLRVVDGWGGQSIASTFGGNFALLVVPSRKISLYTHPSGAIFSAIENGTATEIYHYDRSAATQQLRATLNNFTNPVLSGNDVGALLLGGMMQQSGHSVPITRQSLDGGRVWG